MTKKTQFLFFNIFLLIVLSSFTYHRLAFASPTADYVYTSPKAGAQYVSAKQTILIRPINGFSPDAAGSIDFSVIGSGSGQVAGDIVLVDDNQAALFKPNNPFKPNETVRVFVAEGAKDGQGAILEELSFSFDVSANEIEPANVCGDNNPTQFSHPSQGSSGKYKTVPEEVPLIHVDVNITDTNTAEGYLFLSTFQWDTPQNSINYLMIADDDGKLIFYRELTSGPPSIDFKKQPNELLTFFDGTNNCFKGLDKNYQWIETFEAGNGYLTDNHELLILPNGNYVLMVYDPQPVEGYDVPVEGLVLQELDPAGNVIFQWRSWDHFKITDATIDISGPGRRGTIDYVHGNSIEVDTDGNWLVSSRHIDEITKIDRTTGDVIWRFGGRNNEFEFLNSSATFAKQHDARRLPNGNLSLFDNSGHEYARALEFELDEVAKTAYEVREIGSGDSIAMGNAQWLPNNNKLVGWGSHQAEFATEYDPEDREIVRYSFLGNYWSESTVSYRALRFPWDGVPENPIVFLDQSAQKLYFSSNGVTDPSGENYLYEIRGGVDKNPATLLTTQARTGYEDQLDVSAWPSYKYYQVTLVDQRTNERYVGEYGFHQLFAPLLQVPGQPKILPKAWTIFWLPLDDGPNAQVFRDGQKPYQSVEATCNELSCPTMVSEGVRNRAFKFEEDDYIKVEDTVSAFARAITSEAWVKTTSTKEWSGIVAHFGDGNSMWAPWAQMALSSTGTLRVEIKEGNLNDVRKLYDGQTVINDGEWHHVAFTYDSWNDGKEELKLFVDGQLEDVLILDDQMLDGYARWGHGTSYIGTTRDREVFFDGLIDEVAFQRWALSPAEIEARYESFKGS